MKKLRAAGLLLASLAVLAACGGGTPSLAFQSNWRRNTTSGSEGTSEVLEYAVSLVDPTPQDGFSVDYSGTYKTKLENKKIELGTGSQGGYRFETELDVDVQFTLNGEKSEVFHDTVRTWVEFLTVQDSLRPVRSNNEVRCHAPRAVRPDIATCCDEYAFTYAVTYNDSLTEATSVYTANTASGNVSKTTQYDIEGDGTYLDNEELLLALRGVSPSTAIAFRSLNNVMGLVEEVSFREVTEVEEHAIFEMNGAAVDTQLGAYSVSMGYNGAHSGMAKTVVFAKKVSDTDNTYRNVPLRINSPVLQTLGTLQYTLKKATFAN